MLDLAREYGRFDLLQPRNIRSLAYEKASVMFNISVSVVGPVCEEEDSLGYCRECAHWLKMWHHSLESNGCLETLCRSLKGLATSCDKAYVLVDTVYTISITDQGHICIAVAVAVEAQEDNGRSGCEGAVHGRTLPSSASRV